MLSVTKKIALISLAATSFIAHEALASDTTERLVAVKVASGLSIPWGMAFVNNNELLVSEKTGSVKSVDIDSGVVTPIKFNQNIHVSGQGGLLDIKASPFAENTFYFTYSKKTDTGYDTALAKANYVDGRFEQWQELFVSRSNSDSSHHFGSRVTFDDNYLYMTIGDRGVRENGQDLSTHAGSIVRLMPNGEIPESANKELGAIYSYGHRNPQGIVFDAKTNHLWSIEHGPRGGDEVNLIQENRNYGWPITSHGKEYWGPIKVGEAEEKEGIESPKLVFVPSIAPSSLILYRGDKYPSLDGKLIAGALKLTHLNVMTIEPDLSVTESTRLFGEMKERIRNVVVGPDSYIYFATDNGNIYKIQ